MLVDTSIARKVVTRYALKSGDAVNKSATLAAVAAALVGVVNLVLFAVWWNMIEVTAEMPPSERGYTIETLALNVTFLEIVIALSGFVLAALGIFGYVEIKATAVEKAVAAAEKEAREEANQQMIKFRREMEARRRDGSGLTETTGDYTPAPEVGGVKVTPAGGGE
ncbi:hypothetical protein [Rhodovulum marinum]|uniref:Uncharacterized protein n=1 Tax=Rhodovulum marinum TaxID=320662 RepID=A0A4R2PVL5_9RHOB|nr:hypothetical protein [Rhodovulum marinum]TCP40143.1 hypothetical protein EV662_10817 [Rhodovulum marinum]